MIFAVPIIGKILASIVATEASADASATPKANQVKLQASESGASAPSAFAQALDAVDQAGGSKSHSSIVAQS